MIEAGAAASSEAWRRRAADVLVDRSVTLTDFRLCCWALRAMTRREFTTALVVDRLRSHLLLTPADCREPGHDLVTRTLEAMEGAVRQRRSLSEAEVVSFLRVHRATAWRAFRAHAGMTLSQCLRLCRTRAAALELAASGEQVAQIAFGIGYKNPGDLDRDFRRVLAISPTGLRRLLAEARDTPPDVAS